MRRIVRSTCVFTEAIFLDRRTAFCDYNLPLLNAGILRIAPVSRSKWWMLNPQSAIILSYLYHSTRSKNHFFNNLLVRSRSYKQFRYKSNDSTRLDSNKDFCCVFVFIIWLCGFLSCWHEHFFNEELSAINDISSFGILIKFSEKILTWVISRIGHLIIGVRHRLKKLSVVRRILLTWLCKMLKIKDTWFTSKPFLILTNASNRLSNFYTLWLLIPLLTPSSCLHGPIIFSNQPNNLESQQLALQCNLRFSLKASFWSFLR